MGVGPSALGGGALKTARFGPEGGGDSLRIFQRGALSDAGGGTLACRCIGITRTFFFEGAGGGGAASTTSSSSSTAASS